MREFTYLVLGLALMSGGVFLLIRRRKLFNKNDREVGGYQDFPLDLPNHIKMAGFGLVLLGCGSLSIYRAIVGCFAF